MKDTKASLLIARVLNIGKGTHNSYRGEPNGGLSWDPEASLSSPLDFIAAGNIKRWTIRGKKIVASRRETKNRDEVNETYFLVLLIFQRYCREDMKQIAQISELRAESSRNNLITDDYTYTFKKIPAKAKRKRMNLFFFRWKQMN